MGVNTDDSNSSNMDLVKQFRNKDVIKGGVVFLQKNENEQAEILARNYKNRGEKETLNEKFEKVNKDIDKIPAVCYLLVFPIIYRMYLQMKKDGIDENINKKKEEYENFFKQIIEKGKNDPAQIKEELDTYSKEKLREMSKKIIEKQSALFDEKMGTMDINQIEKVMNNLQTQILSNKGIDMKALATCLSEPAQNAPAQNAQVAGPAKVNAEALKEDRQTHDYTMKADKEKLIEALNNTLVKGDNVKITQQQAGMLNIDVNKEDTTITVPVNGIDKIVKCKQNCKGVVTLGTW